MAEPPSSRGNYIRDTDGVGRKLAHTLAQRTVLSRSLAKSERRRLNEEERAQAGVGFGA